MLESTLTTPPKAETLPVQNTEALPNTQEAKYCQTEHGQQTMREQLLSRLATREQIEEWTGVIGNQLLSRFRKQNEKNREAEDAAVRQKLYGETTEQTASGDGDVNEQVILGGVHNPPAQPAIVYPPHPPREGLGPLASALLAMAIPSAGVAGYLYSQKPDTPAVTQPGNDDTSIHIGLGKEVEPAPE